MKDFNPIASIKRYKLLIIGLSLLAGLACFIFLNQQQSYTAVAIIEYTNKEAVDGLAPDGTEIDPSEIYSTEVMKQVFARMGMDFEDYNLDKFRSKVVVKEILSDEQSAVQEALNEKGETMTVHPTKYSVSITLDKGDAANPETFVRQLMDNMLDVYLQVYGEQHVSSSITVNDIIKPEESNFDYIEIIEVIDDDISDTLQGLGNTVMYGEPFRSSTHGYSFSDLFRELNIIADTDIPNLYAYILNNKITKSADVLIAKYRQRIETYHIENEASLRKIKDIKEVIAAYIDMMRQSGNTDITYEYILEDVYDTYFQNKTKVDENGNTVWKDADETIEYEVLLEAFINNRTDYEYSLIEIAYCAYIIENYGGAVDAKFLPSADEVQLETPDRNVTSGAPTAGTQENTDANGEPLDPEIGVTGNAIGAEVMINDLLTKLDTLYGRLTTLKAEYNEFSGAANVGLISNIVVSADVQVILYTLILMIACFIVISVLVIFVDRFSDIMNYYIYIDRKFMIGNRSACDRYLARHEHAILKSDTSCIAITVRDLQGKNKEYGRENCDAMMKALADRIKRVFPKEPESFIALNGNGQFIIFVEGTLEAQAKAYMRYLDAEVSAYNLKSNCPIEYNYGIAEAANEDIFNARGLLICAINKANAPTANTNHSR